MGVVYVPGVVQEKLEPMASTGESICRSIMLLHDD